MKPPNQFQLGMIIVDEGRVCQQSLKRSAQQSAIRKSLLLTANNQGAKNSPLPQTGMFSLEQDTRKYPKKICTRILEIGHPVDYPP